MRRKDFNSYSKIFLLILMFVSLVFPYKKIKVFVLSPPELTLSGVKQIAVLDFEGQYGRVFTDRLVTQLLEKERGITVVSKGFFSGKEEGKTLQEGTYTNIYEVVERGKLNQILEEQNLSMSGLVGEDQAVQIGKLAGVQAIIIGKVSYTQDTKDGTVEMTDKNGTRNVRARYRRVDVTQNMKVIDIQTGKIMGSIERSRGLEDKKYDKDINNIFKVEDGVDACISSLCEDAANYLTPHFTLQEYELEKINVDNIKKIAEQAAEKAEDLDIDGAYLIYKSAYDTDPYNHNLLYNLGILNEVVGNFNDAQELYSSALQMKSNEKKYKEALERVNKTVEFGNILAQIGVEIQKHNFEFSQADQQEALSQKIQIKGKETDRVIVYVTPEKGGEVAARIPGGTTFSVIEQNGEFYKIKLLGGKEGYVHNDYVEMK